jgi:hypothetical protein
LVVPVIGVIPRKPLPTRWYRHAARSTQLLR